MSRKRRSEILSVEFVDQQASGWAFGVGECFRMQLDVRLDERIDTEASNVKKTKLGRKLEPSEKLKRMVWTQGDPPAYSFDRGHVFHELRESSEGVRRSIVVLLSRPDPGALVEKAVADDEGVDATAIVETTAESTGVSFVDYEVLTYSHGVLNADAAGFAIKVQSSRTQVGFVELLRTGR